MLLGVNLDNSTLAVPSRRPTPKIVLTGAIGAGKSTVVQAALRELGWTAPAGFRTHWGGQERGSAELFLEAWGGTPQVIARRDDAAAGFPYRLDHATFISHARASLLPCHQPVVLDELGVVELASDDFVTAIVQLFRAERPVLAVIQQRVLDRWLERIGRDAVTELLTVDNATREHLPRHIAAVLRGAVDSPA